MIPVAPWFSGSSFGENNVVFTIPQSSPSLWESVTPPGPQKYVVFLFFKYFLFFFYIFDHMKDQSLGDVLFLVC